MARLGHLISIDKKFYAMKRFGRDLGVIVLGVVLAFVFKSWWLLLISVIGVLFALNSLSHFSKS